jgi:hypothetical protein
MREHYSCARRVTGQSTPSTDVCGKLPPTTMRASLLYVRKTTTQNYPCGVTSQNSREKLHPLNILAHHILAKKEDGQEYDWQEYEEL